MQCWFGAASRCPRRHSWRRCRRRIRAARARSSRLAVARSGCSAGLGPRRGPPGGIRRGVVDGGFGRQGQEVAVWLWQEADAVLVWGRVEVPQEAFVAALSTEDSGGKGKRWRPERAWLYPQTGGSRR